MYRWFDAISIPLTSLVTASCMIKTNVMFHEIKHSFRGKLHVISVWIKAIFGNYFILHNIIAQAVMNNNLRAFASLIFSLWFSSSVLIKYTSVYIFLVFGVIYCHVFCHMNLRFLTPLNMSKYKANLRHSTLLIISKSLYNLLHLLHSVSPPGTTYHSRSNCRFCSLKIFIISSKFVRNPNKFYLKFP